MNLIEIVPYRGIFALKINSEIGLAFPTEASAVLFIASDEGRAYISDIVDPKPAPIPCPPPYTRPRRDIEARILDRDEARLRHFD